MRPDSRRDRWSTPRLWAECARKFQLLRRLQCSDKDGFCVCVTCGKRGHYKTMQGGHFITRARKSTLLDPVNVHPQCVACNKYGNGKPASYLEFMLAAYGRDAVDDLSLKSNQACNVNRGQLMEIYGQICEEVKKEERRVTG